MTRQRAGSKIREGGCCRESLVEERQGNRTRISRARIAMVILHHALPGLLLALLEFRLDRRRRTAAFEIHAAHAGHSAHARHSALAHCARGLHPSRHTARRQLRGHLLHHLKLGGEAIHFGRSGARTGGDATHTTLVEEFEISG